MNNLCYFTQSALELLRDSVEKNLDWYYSPKGELSQITRADIKESRVKVSNFLDKLKVDSTQSQCDIENAITVFDELKELTPHQASIERMWAYLCHYDCREYVRERWLKIRPENNDKAIRLVRNHFFGRTVREIKRDNGISRLWWLGKIANDVAPDEPRKFLNLLLQKGDIRVALIDRESVSMNRYVLQKIYAVMLEHLDNKSRLFERTVFREWMKALNRRGGVILLDSLPENDLIQLLREETDRAISQFSN